MCALVAILKGIPGAVRFSIAPARVRPSYRVVFGACIGSGLEGSLSSTSIAQEQQQRRFSGPTMCAGSCPAAETGKESETEKRSRIKSLSVGEIRSTLKALGVSTEGIFEKEELMERLVQAELQGLPKTHETTTADNACARPGQGDSKASSGTSGSRTEDYLIKCMAMKTGELRTELQRRRIACEDLFEKQEFAERLARELASEAAFCRSGRVLPGRVSQLNGSELTEEIKGTGRGPPSDVPLVVDIFAPWCGPCKAMAPALDAAAARLGMRARVVKVDSDREPAAVATLGIRAFPTVLLFDVCGKEIGRREGELTEDQLLNLVGKVKE